MVRRLQLMEPEPRGPGTRVAEAAVRLRDGLFRDNKVLPPVLAALALIIFAWLLAGVVIGDPGEEERVARQAAQPSVVQAPDAGGGSAETPAPGVENRDNESIDVYESKDPFRELFPTADAEDDAAGEDTGGTDDTGAEDTGNGTDSGGIDDGSGSGRGSGGDDGTGSGTGSGGDDGTGSGGSDGSGSGSGDGSGADSDQYGGSGGDDFLDQTSPGDPGLDDGSGNGVGSGSGSNNEGGSGSNGGGSGNRGNGGGSGNGSGDGNGSGSGSGSGGGQYGDGDGNGNLFDSGGGLRR